ncbi:MAG: hypothetical protein WCF67_17390 [Chitinophagaceae bacterium]
MWQSLPELVNGVEILKPFLFRYGFTLDDFENYKGGSGGQVTEASFTKGNKKFNIGYRYSLGKLNYHCGDAVVTHAFYLDGLGYAEQKKFPDFQSDDKLKVFRNILHDLEYLVDDFFAGDCSRLKMLAVQEAEQTAEYNRKAQIEYNYSFEKIFIDDARREFKNKDYKKCLANYDKVVHMHLLTDLDRKFIEFCKKHQ